MSKPVFAVVGHPNKGKSSIVSTLAHDDSVTVGRIPGTTTRCRAYPMTVDGEVLYTLVDTPGFQRARRALEWMQKHESTADKHSEVVRAFLGAHRKSDLFVDECELLSPLMSGAGILYVVDGSLPYGSEYEAEMEILRWTGRPRMALINPIGEADHIESWKAALNQYFSVVRVFDAVSADFYKRIELLRAFGQLQGDWRLPLQQAVDSLEQSRAQSRLSAASCIAGALSEMLLLKLEKKVDPEVDTTEAKLQLETDYRMQIQRLEGRCRKKVEDIYDHHKVDRIEQEIDLLDAGELFSGESWRLFGLSRTQLLKYGIISGAMVGGAIDLAVGQVSMFLGSILGGGIGAATTLMAADQLINIRILNMPLGHTLLVAGPTRNINLPHMVFARARLHHTLISRRTHADRGELKIEESLKELVRPLKDQERRDLEKIFGRLRTADEAVGTEEELAKVIADIFSEDDRGGIE